MNFEEKLQKTFSSTGEMLEPEQFINKLTTARYAQALKRSQAISGYLALIVVLFVGILGYNELDQGAILMDGSYYYSTSIDFDQDENSEYFDDLALYIMEQEEDIWMVFSFLDELAYDKIVNLMEEES